MYPDKEIESNRLVKKENNERDRQKKGGQFS